MSRLMHTDPMTDAEIAAGLQTYDACEQERLLWHRFRDEATTHYRAALLELQERRKAERRKTETWFCEQCETTGDVVYAEDEADVISVVGLIGSHHRGASPGCPSTERGLRVFNASVPYALLLPDERALRDAVRMRYRKAP